MNLHKSGEDYLEAILMLKQQKGSVRSIDVAHHLSFSKPSVSRAVSNLRRDGYLIMHEDGELELTELGYQVASGILERHTMLTSLLQTLGVSDDVAAEDACKIEHTLSQETFEKIKAFYLSSVETQN